MSGPREESEVWVDSKLRVVAFRHFCDTSVATLAL